MKSRIKHLMCALGLLVLLLCAVQPAFAKSDDPVLLELQTLLVSSNNQDRTKAIELLTQSQHELAFDIYGLLLEGKFFFNRTDNQLYLVDRAEAGQSALHFLDERDVTIERPRDFRRVALNNAQRTQIRRVMAQTGLTADSNKIRMKAVRQMMGDPDPEALSLIRAAYTSETNGKVRELMAVAIAIDTVTQTDEAAQRDAIDTLSTSLEPRARNALNQFVSQTDNASLKELAEKGLIGIEQKIKFYKGLETVYFGLSLGSVLVLAAIGLAITFGVMGVINMAHGELIMIGAYTTFVIQQLMPNHIGLSVLVAIPAAFVVSGLVGIAIERGVIRFLYGRPLETLLATFGISLVLQQAVRTIFSPLNKTVETPSWMSGMLEFNPVFAITLNRLYIIIFCLLVFFALLMILKRTALGLQVRAVSQNRAMARAMGVRSERVDMMTFGLGSGVAGIAGVALSQITNVGPNLGQAYIIDSFMVVVFGGVGNIWGTLVAGMTLGVANKIMEPWAGAVLAKILVLVFIILFIQKKPRGLFPQRGRAAEG
ncbi:urea ABC transporter permease subunit UrtB [Nitrincola tibetensis]|uniref:Urea ABC transporter permease subunit UrtB n=1 Tax=Nitrincola tibetensis TaxID=2219697 RepID=A0A364NPE3_9GAMM|nr:urea ABC transporter permease subunit UrtB [Nitrincola tibetensis]RAU18969.1 urea ABC transporter permease subunit UrtB [Nitrincola tibetensis]